ncbi:peptidoglycan-binding protein [Streptomyces albicerus]|uniref:peptidoglycan-binding protein n=1 Tax=Streptomyces albicerus TaxID=2569859 RepID=UPI00124B8B33|nr:peptidoglycan-binding protein [Streptomyces albicerus]
MSKQGDSSGLTRRKRSLTAVAVGSVVLVGAALWTSVYVKSPAQAAAEAQPPAPDVLTATVERRVLADTVVTRGAVSASQTVDIAPGGTAAEDAARPVVTKVMVRSGQTFRGGRVLVEVSGRPVFALRGKLPVYRDLKPGSHGDDVRQLQEALRDLGHATGADAAGTFGAGTKAAVGALYASIGYEPVTTGGGKDGGDPLEGARDEVKGAQRALDGLVRDKADADEIRYAREDLAEAESELADAEAVSGPMVPASEVVFLSGFPARVDSMTAKVGAAAGEKLATVSAGKLVVTGFLGAQEKDLIRPGQKVQVLSEVYGDELTGTVSAVANTPTVPEADGEGAAAEAPAGQGYAVTVKPDRALPGRLAGQDVRLTVEAGSSGGKVLVVPVSALSAGADSRTRVTVLERSGDRRRVEVRPGTSGDGYTEVTPVGGARLAEGDKVVVGVRPAEGDEAAK